MRYYPCLDGLRAFAAIAVVAFHTRFPSANGGFLGVDVFFVLSGFLTTSLLLAQREEGYDLQAMRIFVGRRLRRLWPLLLCVGGAVALADPSTLWEVVPGVLFAGNVSTVQHQTLGLFVHSWTLATEMQFYVVLALLGFLGAGSMNFIRALFFGYVLTTSIRLYCAVESDWFTGFYSPLSHSSGLFLGGLLATAPQQSNRTSRLLLATAMLSVAVAMITANFATSQALTLWIFVTELASAALIWTLTREGSVVCPILSNVYVRKLGTWSYGVYLWHYPIAVQLRDVLAPWAAFSLTLALSIAISALTFSLIESRFRMTRSLSF